MGRSMHVYDSACALIYCIDLYSCWPSHQCHCYASYQYQIYYQTEGDQRSVDIDAGITEFSITGLSPRLTYNISLVALSVHLPSPVVELEGITLG